MREKIRIIMYSSADKIDGQGVGSAYLEQVNLIKEGASDLFDVESMTGSKHQIFSIFILWIHFNFFKMQDPKAACIV